jgi:hypothetical protein
MMCLDIWSLFTYYLWNVCQLEITQQSLAGVLIHLLLRSDTRCVARKTDTLQEETGCLWVGRGAPPAWLANIRRCKQMLYCKMKHIWWSTYFSFPWVLHFSGWRERKLVHRMQSVRFRTCWIHACQVLHLLPLATFNLTFVESLVQFCNICTHSTTYMYPLCNICTHSATYVATLQHTCYKNVICFISLKRNFDPVK